MATDKASSRPDSYQPTPGLSQPQPSYIPQEAQGVLPPVYPYPATPLLSLHKAPAVVDCPRCKYRVMTRVDLVSGGTTHAWAAITCFCCCLGCLPYLASTLKDVDHYCGQCGVLIATWHNSGRVELATMPTMPKKYPPPQVTSQSKEATREAPQDAPQHAQRDGTEQATEATREATSEPPLAQSAQPVSPSAPVEADSGTPCAMENSNGQGNGSNGPEAQPNQPIKYS